VFAVEPTTVQLSWRALAAGSLVVHVAGARHELPTTGGPGTAVVGGLPPDTTLTLRMVDATGREHRRAVATLPELGGPERFRFATLSDLHLCSGTFGFWNTVDDRSGGTPSSVVAARAALLEAIAWGAELLVLKGDLTSSSAPHEWQSVADLVERCPIPVVAVPGNHDATGSRHGSLDAAEQLAALGIGDAAPVRCVDVPGLRIVLVDSTCSGRDRARIDHVADLVVAAVANGGRPAFVAMHHHLMPLPLPVSWPPGIGSHSGDALLRRLAAVEPDTFVTSGHTHRNRRRRLGPVTTTEVGSPKDYPGVWAGYVVHDTGIRQTVFRVGDPDVLRWNDRTARAALGLWGRWSPGPLDHRCFVQRWSRTSTERDRSAQ
jgi:predicted phosphodiesterase